MRGSLLVLSVRFGNIYDSHPLSVDTISVLLESKMSFSNQSGSHFKPLKLKTKRFKPKHQKAKLFRASEPLLSVFMWGVNHTINELTHVNIPVMLMPDDFKAFTKIKVDNHLFNKENMPSHFKVKEYCPLVFRNLRERFQIDDIDFVNSLTKSQPVAVDSPGRSGAKFYESYDHLFILKTLTSDEVESMHHLLKEYHPYIVERHGKTLLPQYLGMYRITVEGSETYIVVMRNICSSSLTVHRKYDLKGSTVDREASEKERGKEIPVLKDNDFIRDGVRIFFPDDQKQKFLEMLEADCAFLVKKNMMDYSLCVAIHDCEKAEQEAMECNASEKIAGSAEEEDEGESSGGDRGDLAQSAAVPTPPDSPRIQHKSSDASDHNETMCRVDPNRDIYAHFSNSGKQKQDT